jgi:Toprim domain
MGTVERPAAEIARRLADHAEAVCRHYLSHGRREGRYWLVGNVANAPGRSLYVRLVATADGRGAAGKWTDGATGEHGDLLDIIARSQEYARLGETLAEARRFLGVPRPDPDPGDRPGRRARAPGGTAEAARRLLAASRDIAGTLVSAHLQRRAIVDLRECGALRFHPRCHYRPGADDAPGTPSAWPAMIAAVTDPAGAVTGVHRTWLDPATCGKAAVASPRRALGHLLGNAVRFGMAGAVMAAGEGIETVLSLRQILPRMPMAAGLSSAHLAAMLFPPRLRRLYLARDLDPAGDAAMAILAGRAASADIELVPLTPLLDDFNDDLRFCGIRALRQAVDRQLRDEDRATWCD